MIVTFFKQLKEDKSKEISEIKKSIQDIKIEFSKENY